jgi:hypothetical protein
MFGAYFGLAATYFFNCPKAIEDRFAQGKGNYVS